jgi:hypothetical protein
MWNRKQPYIQSKIAIDLSHFRLLERIVATGRPAVILEDDAQIDMMGKQWLPNLLTALQELPEVRRQCQCWVTKSNTNRHDGAPTMSVLYSTQDRLHKSIDALAARHISSHSSVRQPDGMDPAIRALSTVLCSTLHVLRVLCSALWQ